MGTKHQVPKSDALSHRMLYICVSFCRLRRFHCASKNVPGYSCYTRQARTLRLLVSAYLEWNEPGCCEKALNAVTLANTVCMNWSASRPCPVHWFTQYTKIRTLCNSWPIQYALIRTSCNQSLSNTVRTSCIHWSIQYELIYT